MKAESYFKKNGFIYGISENVSRQTGYIRKFDNMEEAEKWLHTEEGDFRERELCSKTKAMKSGYEIQEDFDYYSAW